jgi:hypothetical protein
MSEFETLFVGLHLVELGCLLPCLHPISLLDFVLEENSLRYATPWSQEHRPRRTISSVCWIWRNFVGHTILYGVRKRCFVHGWECCNDNGHMRVISEYSLDECDQEISRIRCLLLPMCVLLTVTEPGLSHTSGEIIPIPSKRQAFLRVSKPHL